MSNHKNMISSLVLLITLLVSTVGCNTMFPTRNPVDDGLTIPFLKNNPNECYFLDEFMPVPHNLVTGKNGSMNLRYYTYHDASYKEWSQKNIILSFYSKDSRCWSLFEEYYSME